MAVCFSGHAHELAGERVRRVGLRCCKTIALGEGLGLELPGRHLAVLVDGRARDVDRGRRLRVPAVALVAHALHAHRLADRLARARRRPWRRRRNRCGRRSRDRSSRSPSPSRPAASSILATPSRAVVRLLRARPHRRLAVAHVGDAAGRRHAGMRLERPFVDRFDHLGGVGEGGIDVADLLPPCRAATTVRLADVVVDRRPGSGNGGLASDQVTLSFSEARMASHSLRRDHADEALFHAPPSRPECP